MKVTFIIGALCSGKTTMTQHCDEEDVIEIGQIVRNLTTLDDRLFDKDLDIAINNRVFQIISKAFYHAPRDLVVVGIRQLSVFTSIEKVCNDLGVEMEVWYLEVPEDIRKQRYESRNSSKDVSITFEFANRQDNTLGLTELIEHITQLSHTRIIQNY